MTSFSPAAKADEIVISPQTGWVGIDWRELWDYRDLLATLVWRDLKVRYKQTALGVAWAVLQPLVATVIFAVIFGHFAKMPSDNRPYAVFALAALIPWTFFANGVSQSALALIAQQGLVNKVYFPRVILPIAAVTTGVPDMAISLALYAVFAGFYRISPTLNLSILPVLVVLSIVSTCSIGILLSGLTVMYRDFKHVIPFALQIWMYATPIVYSDALVPAKYSWIIALNPMAGIIKGYRCALLGLPIDAFQLGTAAIVSVVLLVVGLLYFRKVERRFADIA